MSNKLKIKREDASIKRVTWAGILSLFALLLFFTFVTINNTSKLTAQIKLLTEHPFTVNGDISDVRTDLAMMRIRTERLQSYNQPQDIQKVRTALEDLYEDMEVLLDEITYLYLGPAEDVDALREVYDEIQDAQADLIQFAAVPASTNSMIAAYEEENLYPLYNALDEKAKKILTYVRGTQQSIFTSAEQMGRSALVWSLVIFTAMTIGLFYFQSAIRKISGRLYEKTRQFDILSETVDETFLIFNKDEPRCDFVSGGSQKMLGVSADRIREDRSLMYGHMNEGTVKALQEKVHGADRSTWETTFEYSHPQRAKNCWLQLRLYHIGEAEDQTCIITLTDRTEERRASQALQDALISAQNANNAKKDFLSRMSHEIRTPMNAIIGMTTIAAASIQDSSRVEDCLEKISYSSKHLLMLINDVLDMSRIESNRVRLGREPFELFQFLNNFVAVVYPEASSKGLEFTEKTVGFSEHSTYLGDSFRLNQILLNLVSNAIKFTPSGGKVSLEVTRLRTHGYKTWLRFVVSDTGIGMDEEALSRLYTPFEQADASIARKYGGTGLGMPITQNLVNLMGGVINVKSKPGEGTTFTVELPFEPSDVDLQPVQEGALETLKVLVVDDEQDICEHTVLLLKRMKIDAEWVLSGIEAVDRAETAYEMGQGYDVCFIDWKMPGMDGIEVTRRIREKVGRETPIIIISAYDWSEIEEEARRAGANAFIAKPLFQSSLYNVLVGVTNGAFGMPRTVEKAMGDRLRGMRLLLAEDNVLNMEIAVSLLEMNGAYVETAEDGQEAVRQFLKADPGYYDAVLMDIQMPVMDGLEAARQIRACGRTDAESIPIIATTANAFVEDVSAALAAGMNAHVSKPLDIKQLCAILSQFCGSKRGECPM